MSRQKFKQSAVETLVLAFLSHFKSTKKFRGYILTLTKASKMIGIALHSPCCEPAEEIILGPREDGFIIALRALLQNANDKVFLRRWSNSLQRAKDAIDKVVLQTCC